MEKIDLESLAYQILEYAQKMYFHRCCLMVLLHEAQVPDWRDRYDRMVEDEDALARIDRQFEPIFARLEKAFQDQDGLAAKELLRQMPVKGPPV